MSFDFSGLTFKHDDLVSQGGERFVYTHSDYTHFVFKRQKQLAELERKSGMKGWMLRNFPDFTNRIIKKEYRAYVDTCLAAYDDLEKLPVSKIFGFAQSNIGVVQIAEKVTLDGTSIGPTLSQLHRTGGLSAERLDLLNEFVALLIRFNIPTNDVSAQNVVLGRRRGLEKFICVDGFGDIHLVPVRTYSARVRRDMLAERMQKMARNLDLRFDKALFAFSRQ